MSSDVIEQNPNPTRSEFEPGTLVANRYRIIHALGQGGMGSVYLVEDTVLDNERVAIKILHREFTFHEQHTKRFLREVKLMHRVNHPNVVRTFDVGADGNLIYFTMEYIKATPLDILIDSYKFPTENTISIVSQICEGLEAIHETGIVHRDLKPGNILLLEDGTVKITDFGVARPQSSDLTAHNEIVGSAAYVAPEIWEGKPVAPSVDIYSLGIIFYEIATGIVPFDAESPAALMRMHLNQEPIPPKEMKKDTPAWFNRLILKLLAKSPKDRFESAGAIIDYVTQYESRGYIFSSSTEVKGAGPCVKPEFLYAMEEIAEQIESGESNMADIILPSRDRLKAVVIQTGESKLKGFVAGFMPKFRYLSQLAGSQLTFSLLSVLFILFFAVLCSEIAELVPVKAERSLSWLLLSGLPKAFAAILMLSIPAIALSSLSRSLLQVARATLLTLIFMLLAGSILTISHLEPLYEVNKSADLSSIAAAARGAAEQLTGIALLSPAISKFQSIVIDQNIHLQWLNFSPVYFSPLLIITTLMYLFIIVSIAYRAIATNSDRALSSTAVLVIGLCLTYGLVLINLGTDIQAAPRETFSFFQIPLARPAWTSVIFNWLLLFTATMVSGNLKRRKL